MAFPSAVNVTAGNTAKASEYNAVVTDLGKTQHMVAYDEAEYSNAGALGDLVTLTVSIPADTSFEVLVLCRNSGATAAQIDLKLGSTSLVFKGRNADEMLIDSGVSALVKFIFSARRTNYLRAAMGIIRGSTSFTNNNAGPSFPTVDMPTTDPLTGITIRGGIFSGSGTFYVKGVYVQLVPKVSA